MTEGVGRGSVVALLVLSGAGVGVVSLCDGRDPEAGLSVAGADVVVDVNGVMFILLTITYSKL